MQALFFQLLNDESGATMVEYALMLALIAAVCIVAVALIGRAANTVFEDEILKNGLGG